MAAKPIDLDRYTDTALIAAIRCWRWQAKNGKTHPRLRARLEELVPLALDEAKRRGVLARGVRPFVDRDSGGPFTFGVTATVTTAGASIEHTMPAPAKKPRPEPKPLQHPPGDLFDALERSIAAAVNRPTV